MAVRVQILGFLYEADTAEEALTLTAKSTSAVTTKPVTGKVASLKKTRVRDLVTAAFATAKGPLSSSDVYRLVREQFPTVLRSRIHLELYSMKKANLIAVVGNDGRAGLYEFISSKTNQTQIS